MRWGFWLLAALAVLLSAGGAFAAEAGQSREETLTLQRRLTDAGCYHGAIDGTPSAALDAAVKACPDQSPFLRIETGMHTATIHRIGVDAACHRMATASGDKTVRLWSLPDGTLERTITSADRNAERWARSMRSHSPRTATTSLRAGGTPPMRSSGLTAFHSLISTRARSAASRNPSL